MIAVADMLFFFIKKQLSALVFLITSVTQLKKPRSTLFPLHFETFNIPVPVL
jgi:hypothetical protein